MTEPTILAAIAAALVRAAEGAGVDRAELLQQAGIDEELLADPDARIPLRLHLRLDQALSAHPIGLEVGRRLGADSLGVVGYAMRHDATLGRALAWLERYRAVVFEDLLAQTERRGEAIAFCHPVHPLLMPLREPAEIWAAAQLAVLRQLTGVELVPLVVRLPHTHPADLRRHEDYFRCPIEWEARQVELELSASILELPLTRSDPELFRYLARQADRLQASLLAPTVTAQVRQIVHAELPHGEPEIDAVARSAGMSARTLQRRLAEEGASFSRLVDEVRRERAFALLEDERLAAGEVAFLLGYSDPAPFFRAFRRWSGTTPRAWREARRGGGLAGPKATGGGEGRLPRGT